MNTLPKTLESYPTETHSSEQQEINERLSEILPPYIPETSLTARAKHFFRMFVRATLTICLLLPLGLGAFLAYRVVRERETFWHYLKNNQTVTFTLTNQKKVQDAAIDDVLEQLTKPGQTFQEKLIQLTIDGYARSDWDEQHVVVYDQKVRSNYQMIFNQRIQPAIDQAYSIYNNFDPETEQKVYGITTNELVYQKRLNVPRYSTMALSRTLFEGRRYFPFALIAGQVAGVDPLRLLKIFEIETDFNETTVGRNTNAIGNDDIGIAQNNLAVLPNLIRHILDPSTPVYSPFFEFLSPGEDWTGTRLTWANYLVRLEEELKGTYNRQENPTGQYYINLLKAPHIGAFLAAYHIKRDGAYRFDECLDFYSKNAKALKDELNLAQDPDPYHWTDYSFYNGGPKRWHVMKKYLQMRRNHEPIPPELQEAVQITKRRNMDVQRIGHKNVYLQRLVFDPVEDEIVANDGLLHYGLYDFSPNFKSRDLMCGLHRNLAIAQK